MPLNQSAQWPPDAASALAALDEAYSVWVTGVPRLDAAALARPAGPAEGEVLTSGGGSATARRAAATSARPKRVDHARESGGR